MVLTEGYKLITEYVNDRTKVILECPKGHRFEILPINWNKGYRCSECYRESLRKAVERQMI